MVGPTMSLNIASVSNANLAGGARRAYNSWILDEWLDGSDAVNGSILVTHHKPERSAEIDDRADESSMRGVYLREPAWFRRSATTGTSRSTRRPSATDSRF